MSDIKSISHQSIHSTQSAPAEGSQKNSEIVKENKPAEFRPLTNEQKEGIKQTRNAESKLAESAIRAKTEAQLFRAIDVAPGSDPSQTGPIVDQVKDAIEKLIGNENPPTHSPTFGFAPPMFRPVREPVRELGAAAADADRDKNSPPSSRKYINRDDIIKPDEAKDSKSEDLLPIGTGPTGEIPNPKEVADRFKRIYEVLTDSPKSRNDVHTANAEHNSSEPVLKAEKFFRSIPLPATPILDGEDEREEEQLTISVFEPLKTPNE